MKKVFVIISSAVFGASCNSSTESNTITPNDTVASVKETHVAVTTYKPAEGDVSRREGKIVVWRNGEWVKVEDDQRLDNGVVVYRDGRVVKNDREMDMKEGEIVNKSGEFFDRTGKAIENAWDDTKRGVRKAGKAIGDAAKKAGDKIEDAVDKDKDKN